MGWGMDLGGFRGRTGKRMGSKYIAYTYTKNMKQRRKRGS